MKKKLQKVLLITLACILLGIIILLAGAWSIFGDKIMASQSVTKLEDKLYYMEFKGDYRFEEFLNNGGASSEAALAEYITSFLSGGFMKSNTNAVPQNFGCSTLAIGNLMGRNYDWQGNASNTMIIHTIPQKGYESYSTCWMDFLGFDKSFKPEGAANQYMSLAAIYVPLDGINEKGLCVVDLVNGDETQTHQTTNKPDITTNSAIRLLLDYAATVNEAIQLLEQYDMNSAIGMSHHLAIFDATGKSVVIEYVNDEMIVTETPVVTNHYLSKGEKYGIGNEESHNRYEKLMTMTSSITDTSKMRDAMKDVSYDGYTQWSIVYNTNDLTLDFYWQRNYEQAHSFAFLGSKH